MGCSEVSQTTWIDCIYLVLKRRNLKFLHNQMEPRSSSHECRTLDSLRGGGVYGAEEIVYSEIIETKPRLWLGEG